MAIPPVPKEKEITWTLAGSGNYTANLEGVNMVKG